MTGTKLQYRDVQIGEVPANWGKVKVNENLVQALGGFSCARTKTVSAGVPHLRPMNVATNGEVVLTADTQYIRPDFRDDLESYHLRKGDILFNNTNSVELVGKTAIVRDPMAVAFSNHINRLRVRDPNLIDPRWLALALRYLRDQGFFATHCNKWIGQAGFSVSELAKVDIPIPYPDDPARSLQTQHCIVARIEALFAEVREARHLHAAIAADAGRIMEAAVSRAFDDGIHSSWKWTTVGDLMTCKPQYGTSQKPNSDRHGLPVLRMGNIQDGELDFTDLKHVDLPRAEAEKYRLRKGDLVFNRTNSAELVGKTAVFESDEPVVCASYLIRFRMDIERVAPRFVSFYINSPLGRTYVGTQLVRAIGQVNVNAQKLSSMPIPIPLTLSEQEEVVKHLLHVRAEVREMSTVKSEHATQFNDLEQAILVQAFRGEL